MNQRDELTLSISKTIRDYRAEEAHVPTPTPDHVDCWARQFDESVQLPLLREMNHVLKNTYLSRDYVSNFLGAVIKNTDLTGQDTCSFWKNMNFLDIQAGGSSQTDLLRLFDELLTKQCGFDRKGCGGNGRFFYLDDCIFSGNRVLQDIKNWIRKYAPKSATLYVVSIVSHSSGQYYAEKNIKIANAESGKNINVKWRRAVMLEDRKLHNDRVDVLRPTDIPDDADVQEYVAGLNYSFKRRQSGNMGGNGLFSSDEGKIRLEQEFLKAGVRIRNMCMQLKTNHRPLGYSKLETPGFGSLIVTFRNCPNSTPLALWANDPWYPLFQRRINE